MSDSTLSTTSSVPSSRRAGHSAAAVIAQYIQELSQAQAPAAGPSRGGPKLAH